VPVSFRGVGVLTLKFEPSLLATPANRNYEQRGEPVSYGGRPGTSRPSPVDLRGRSRSHSATPTAMAHEALAPQGLGVEAQTPAAADRGGPDHHGHDECWPCPTTWPSPRVTVATIFGGVVSLDTQAGAAGNPFPTSC
jgi:hypothetical protein